MRTWKKMLAVLGVLALTLALPMLASASERSLSTTFVGNNNQDGIMFDIVAKSDIDLIRLDTNLVNSGVTYNIEIYYKEGTHVGFEQNAGVWTLVGSAEVNSGGLGNPTPIPIGLSSITLLTGQTGALYITAVPTGYLSTLIGYSDGTAIGNVFAEDENLQILEGTGMEHSFSWNRFSPRVFNGTIFYNDNSEPETYELLVYADAGGTVSTAGGTYEAGDLIEITATADAGYHFVGWFVSSAVVIPGLDDSTNPLVFEMPATDVWVTALFAEDVIPTPDPDPDPEPTPDPVQPVNPGIPPTGDAAALGTILVGIIGILSLYAAMDHRRRNK